MIYYIYITGLHRRLLLPLVIIFLCITYGQAQVTIDTSTQAIDTITPVSQDSIERTKDKLTSQSAAEEKKEEAQQKQEDDVTEVTEVQEDKGYGMLSMFQGNPGRAGLYSLIVPGLGQAYNKRWWKVPVAIGAEVVAISILVNNINRLREVDTEFRRVIAGEPPLIYMNASVEGLSAEREDAKEIRNYAWIGVIAVHIIVAADAFVDRHLIEFDVDDDLTIKASPFSPLPGLNIVMTF